MSNSYKPLTIEEIESFKKKYEKLMGDIGPLDKWKEKVESEPKKEEEEEDDADFDAGYNMLGMMNEIDPTKLLKIVPNTPEKYMKVFNPDRYINEIIVDNGLRVIDPEKLIKVVPPEPKVSNLSQSIIILVDELKNDPGYFYAWQANIAMAIKDEFDRRLLTKESTGDIFKDIHDTVNQGAKNFLNLLIDLK